MDASYILGMAIGVATAILLVIYITTTRSRLLDVPASAKVGLPVVREVRECVMCRHWDLEYGQDLMRKHVPFAQAAEHVSPAQMAVPTRAFIPNPRYEEVRAELDRALDEGAPDARLRELQAELALLNPQILDEEQVNVDPSLERLRWSDFGCCMHHRELRAKGDTCEAFESHVPEVQA